MSGSSEEEARSPAQPTGKRSSGMVVTPPTGPSVTRPDEVDEKLIELLKGDARRSARALAREIGMSPGAVSERISRLEGAGIIKAYRAEIDSSALGLHVRVLVGVQIQQEPAPDEIVESLLDIPEVSEVHIVSGQWDLVVLVEVRDGEHLKDVVLSKIWRTPGFRHSETMLLLGTYNKHTLPPSAGEPSPKTRQGDETPAKRRLRATSS
jgi:Lrp/AsnC family transcriptional regulator, leucine-responsive regulatory protein